MHTVVMLVPLLLGLDWDVVEAKKAAVGKPIRATCFTASWCKACPQIKPQVQELIDEGWPIRFADFDKNEKAAADWNVTLLPTVIVWQGYYEHGRLVGVHTADELRELMRKAGCTPPPQAAAPAVQAQPQTYYLPQAGNNQPVWNVPRIGGSWGGQCDGDCSSCPSQGSCGRSGSMMGGSMMGSPMMGGSMRGGSMGGSMMGGPMMGGSMRGGSMGRSSCGPGGCR